MCFKIPQMPRLSHDFLEGQTLRKPQPGSQYAETAPMKTRAVSCMGVSDGSADRLTAKQSARRKNGHRKIDGFSKNPTHRIRPRIVRGNRLPNFDDGKRGPPNQGILHPSREPDLPSEVIERHESTCQSQLHDKDADEELSW